MPYVHIGSQKMSESGARGAQAEVLFHAVVAAQRTAVEGADRVKAWSPHIDAGSAGEWNRYAGTAIGPPEQQIECPAGVTIGQRILRAGKRIAGDAAIVAEGRNRADVALARGVSGKPIEPVVGQLGVAVNDNQVTIRMQPSSAVDGAREALMNRLLDQSYASPFRRLA